MDVYVLIIVVEAALVSASVALIVFAGSIFFNHIQHRHILLTAKLEELYRELELMAEKAAEGLSNTDWTMGERISHIVSSLKGPKMLIEIYFSDLRGKFEFIEKQSVEVAKLLEGPIFGGSGEAGSGDKKSSEEFLQTAEVVIIYRKNVDALQKHLLDNARELTKSPLRHFNSQCDNDLFDVI